MSNNTKSKLETVLYEMSSIKDALNSHISIIIGAYDTYEKGEIDKDQVLDILKASIHFFRTQVAISTISLCFSQVLRDKLSPQEILTVALESGMDHSKAEAHKLSILVEGLLGIKLPVETKII